MQLHKRFTDGQVKELLARYIKKELKRRHVQEILGIGKTRLFALIEAYRKEPEQFSIQYERESSNRISSKVEKNIFKELAIEKGLIQNKEVPLKSYNYSYIKERLEQHYAREFNL